MKKARFCSKIRVCGQKPTDLILLFILYLGGGGGGGVLSDTQERINEHLLRTLGARKTFPLHYHTKILVASILLVRPRVEVRRNVRVAKSLLATRIVVSNC